MPQRIAPYGSERFSEIAGVKVAPGCRVARKSAARERTALSLLASVLAHALIMAAAILFVRTLATPLQPPETAATMLFEAASAPAAPTPDLPKPSPPSPAPTKPAALPPAPAEPAAPTPAPPRPAPPTPPRTAPAPPPPAASIAEAMAPMRAAVPPPAPPPLPVAFTPPPPPPAAKVARAAAAAAKPLRTAKHRSRPATAAAQPAASPPVGAPAQAAAAATSHHTVTTAHPVAGLAGNVAPQYTPAEVRRREQGTVALRIQVSPDGRAVSVTVESSSGFADLDATARMTILADWRFVPATVDGISVLGYCVQSVHFTLPDEDQ